MTQSGYSINFYAGRTVPEQNQIVASRFPHRKFEKTQMICESLDRGELLAWWDASTTASKTQHVLVIRYAAHFNRPVN